MLGTAAFMEGHEKRILKKFVLFALEKLDLTSWEWYVITGTRKSHFESGNGNMFYLLLLQMDQ